MFNELFGHQVDRWNPKASNMLVIGATSPEKNAVSPASGNGNILKVRGIKPWSRWQVGILQDLNIEKEPGIRDTFSSSWSSHFKPPKGPKEMPGEVDRV